MSLLDKAIEALDMYDGNNVRADEALAELARLRRMADDVDKLRNRILFYESVMKGCLPHSYRGAQCKTAYDAGTVCCNPECNGNWGTGCWCCHYLQFAIEKDDEFIAIHLDLPREKGEGEGLDVAHRCEDPFCWKCGDDGYDQTLQFSPKSVGGKNRCGDCYGLGEVVLACDCCTADCDTCGGTGRRK